MKKIMLVAITILLALTGCGIDGKKPIPDPVPDHGAPVIEAMTIKVEFSVRDIQNRSIAGRHIIGTAKMIDVQGKPMIGRDEKTGAEVPAVLPFQVTTNADGSATAQIRYDVGAVKLEIGAILQGYGGDALLMEISNVFDALMPLGSGSIEYCEITRKGGQIGACSVHADVILT